MPTHPTRSVVPCAVTWGFGQPDARYTPIERLGAETRAQSRVGDTAADRAIAALDRIKQARKDAEAEALSTWILS